MPPRRTTAKGYLRAHQLRKEPTAAETKLWAYLRSNKLKGFYFRRQNAFGKYIADFCALKRKLIIELDGSQHLDQVEYDEERTLYLESQGYRVIRFWNDQVMNDIEGVIKVVILELEGEETPSGLRPSPPNPTRKVGMPNNIIESDLGEKSHSSG